MAIHLSGATFHMGSGGWRTNQSAIVCEDWAGPEVFLASVFHQHPLVANGHGEFMGKDHTSVIFLLCSIMYGGVGLLWTLFWVFFPSQRDDSFLNVMMLVITWASCSIGMIVINKHLAGAFEAPALIAIAQMAICFATAFVMWWRKLLEANRRQLAIWMIIPCFFAGMLCSSIYTVEHISLSLFTVIRNLMPLVTLPAETVFMPGDKQPGVDKYIVLSLFITLAGAVMYAEGLSNVSMLGVMFAVMNMLITVCDRILQRRLLTEECKDLHVVVCTMVTNLFGMVPCVALAFVTPQVKELPLHESAWTDPRALILLVLSGLVSIGIGAFGFEVQRRLSATSFLIMQNIAKIAVILIGVCIFGDVIRSPLAGSGLLVSLAGGFMYSRLQMKLNQKATETKPLIDRSQLSKA